MTTIYVDNPPPRYIDQVRDGIKAMPGQAQIYFKDLFPIVHWLPKYNLVWFLGDLTAAITVGTLVIPQSLAYAKIANLPPVFGLYTSFVGVIIYPLFGTSKDVSIGVSAITSLMVGQVMGRFTSSPQFLSGEWTMADAAINLSLFSGLIVLGIGLLRLGAVFHFISQPAISGFMAGSGLTIVINQFSKIFGIPNINTSEVPYLVFGKTLIHLHKSTLDAAFGLTALAYLYGVKYLSIYLIRRYPQHNRLIFFFNTSRSIVVLVFATLICYMINHFGHFEKSPFTIIGVVPAGFGHMGVPQLKPDILSFFTGDLPGIIVLMIMEHGVISNSLGKISDYKVNMSQETLATGLANVFGSFFCAYPGTGAFSRTGLMSKSGARTPMTSFFVGIIVVLSIYVFTPAFTYIPNAALSAIIAHSVSDLIFGPTVWKTFWDLNPGELVVFALAYIIALCARIDISVYVPVAISLVIQLYRTARPNYAILGQLDLEDPQTDEKDIGQQTLYFDRRHPTVGKYIRPIDEKNSIICFQPQENIIFQNSAFVFEKLMDEIKSKTRRGQAPAEKLGDRAWNNAQSLSDLDREKALLQSVVLDLSGVHQMDFSGMEGLKDAAVQTQRYTGRPVHWYIVTGDSATVRKSLLFAGFGNQRRDVKHPGRFLSDLLHGVEEGGHAPGIEGCCSHLEVQEDTTKMGTFDNVITIEQARRQQELESMETGSEREAGSQSIESARWCYCDIRTEGKQDRIVAVHDIFPYFFISLHEAVRTALAQKEAEIDDDEKISVISDRGNDSHGRESSSST
ncbi:hypothetical protein INT47_004695 [Mucor saturninus]|uniref:STAS domain-containing protein n=1 Tax=Mucor saturninus TaxID=64648 RepID=A0A8H7QLM2_9FUNG|nr:hypothetical protein INT47_004695 [Mucor saturninus]